MTSGPLLVLDFDGVICDSVDECFISSWTAYYRLHLGRSPSPPDPAARRGFAALRPFVRSGEDFVFIQEILGRGLEVDGQGSFDETARGAGDGKRARYRDLFYRAREEHLRSDRAGWLALNRIYPHMAEAFSRLPSSAPLFILSTKKPPFISEILAANGIRMSEERVVWSDAEPKLRTVSRLRGQSDRGEAVFVEDQIDAIEGNTDPGIRAYLATWGYVKKEWLGGDTTVRLLTPEGFLELVDKEFGRD